MPVLRIPTPLRSYTSGQSEVPVQGGTVAEAMHDLIGPVPIPAAPPVQRRRATCAPLSTCLSAKTTSKTCRAWKRRSGQTTACC